MDWGDESGLEYHMNLDEDNVVMFDIPEEPLEASEDFGADPGSEDELYGDDGFSEPEDFVSEGFPDIEDASGGSGHGNLPEFVTQLQEQLLDGYTLPPCPTQAPSQPELSRAERLSLQHYIA